MAGELLHSIGIAEDLDRSVGFQKIVRHLFSGKKIIFITGAGISVSSGIPDFRSAGGLYERVGLKYAKDLESVASSSSASKKTAHVLPQVNGKDFFDVNFFNNEASRPLFYRFIAELKELCDQAEPSDTHQFIKEFVKEGKAIRWYTQNIDGLEEKTGLETSMKKTHLKNVPVIGLHGTLGQLVCTICHHRVPYGEDYHKDIQVGKAPECPACRGKITAREAKGQRRIPSGLLRPDIVLYNEPHPHGDSIADHLTSDLTKRPTMLVVIGTSLKVVGLKTMIKDIATAIHAVEAITPGMVVFINKTPLPKAEWKNIFDFELIGECDGWIGKVREEILRIAAPSKSLIIEIKGDVKNEEPEERKDKVVEEHSKSIQPKNQDAKIGSFFKAKKSSSSMVTRSKKQQTPVVNENTAVSANVR
jgi:NAD+-dependent protein deacetylase SIR2